MTNYYELPDSLESSSMKKYFLEFIYQYRVLDHTKIHYAVNELLELADRQWHTYELLDEEVKKQLEEYLMTIIDFDDEEIMDCILCIIPRLGMKNLFDYILHNKKKSTNAAVLQNIIESENEYAANVEDPYSGMN